MTTNNTKSSDIPDSTYAAYRILRRIIFSDGSSPSFAAFKLGGSIRIINSTADEFDTFLHMCAQDLIGIYNHNTTLDVVLEDLRPHYSKELP